jgi:hypothetical protein
VSKRNDVDTARLSPVSINSIRTLVFDIGLETFFQKSFLK